MSHICQDPLLIIEDEPMLSLTLGDHLRDRGFCVLEAQDGPTGLDLFHKHKPALVVLDLRMSPMDGHAVLAAIRKEDMDTPVIIVSGQGQMDDVIRTLRAGAFDYLQKPIADLAILDHAVDRALDRSALKRGNAMLSRSFLAHNLQSPEDFAELLTMNPRMRDIFRYCEAVAQSREPVLITGETGVGKELLARALHKSSHRPGPFVAVNVAGLDDHAFSDTLFGHMRGAFTGAERPREGMMEKAADGTLFLDEVGDLGQQAQLRLLRVLQEREFHPLGSDSPRPLRASILAATNRPLDELRKDNAFRTDFFFRLCTHAVALPPLRERPEDIALLLRHFLFHISQDLGRTAPECAPGLIGQLQAYPFPGNVRELKAMVHDALGRCGASLLETEAFPALRGLAGQTAEPNPHDIFTAWSTLPSIRAATNALVAEAMRRAGGIQKTAASMLGISPQALSERLKRQ